MIAQYGVYQFSRSENENLGLITACMSSFEFPSLYGYDKDHLSPNEIVSSSPPSPYTQKNLPMMTTQNHYYLLYPYSHPHTFSSSSSHNTNNIDHIMSYRPIATTIHQNNSVDDSSVVPPHEWKSPEFEIAKRRSRNLDVLGNIFKITVLFFNILFLCCILCQSLNTFSGFSLIVIVNFLIFIFSFFIIPFAMLNVVKKVAKDPNQYGVLDTLAELYPMMVTRNTETIRSGGFHPNTMV